MARAKRIEVGHYAYRGMILRLHDDSSGELRVETPRRWHVISGGELVSRQCTLADAKLYVDSVRLVQAKHAAEKIKEPENG